MSVYNGMKVRRFGKGSNRTLLSAKTANELIDPLNSLLNISIRRGASDSVVISDSGTVITLRQGASDATGDNPGNGDNLGTVEVGGADDTIRDMQLLSDGRIAIGGFFQFYGGIRRTGLALLKSTLAIDAPCWWIETNAGSGARPRVNHIGIELPVNELVIWSEYMAKLGSITHHSSAKAKLDGDFDSGWGASGYGPCTDSDSYGGIVAAMGYVGLDASWILVDCGNRYNSTAISEGIVRITSANGLWPGWSAGTGFYDPVLGSTWEVDCIAVPNNFVAYIGGFFNRYNSETDNVKNFIQIAVDGTLNETFCANAAFNDTVQSLAITEAGKIICGGHFTEFGWGDPGTGTALGGLARVNTDGTLDDTWIPDTIGSLVGIYSIAIQTDGKVIAAGDFADVGGTTRTCIARFNLNGTLDSSFNPTVADTTVSANPIIYKVIAEPGGTVLIAGWFNEVNGVERNNIARLSATGALLGI